MVKERSASLRLEEIGETSSRLENHVRVSADAPP